MKRTKLSQKGINLCDMKSESRLSLQNHVRLFHIKSSFTQTNEILLEDKNIGTCETESNSELFVKYPCYYCDREIANEENLRRHGLSCTQLVFLSNQVSSLTVSTIHPRNEPQCGSCRWTENCGQDLTNHMKRMQSEVLKCILLDQFT